LSLRENRFCLVVVNALEAFTVGYRNFASSFQSASVVAYGQSVLRLAVRLPLVTCDVTFYVFAPPLRWVMSIECGGLEDGCDKGHKLNDYCIAAVAKLLWGFFLCVLCELR